MGKIRNFEEMPIWQDSILLAQKVYKITDNEYFDKVSLFVIRLEELQYQ